MKHTPGPWRIATGSDSLIVAGDNGLHIATVATTGMGFAVKPNAQLIASAPAMLAALKAILGHTDAGSTIHGFASRAIAQATGKD